MRTHTHIKTINKLSNRADHQRNKFFILLLCRLFYNTNSLLFQSLKHTEIKSEIFLTCISHEKLHKKTYTFHKVNKVNNKNISPSLSSTRIIIIINNNKNKIFVLSFYLCMVCVCVNYQLSVSKEISGSVHQTEFKWVVCLVWFTVSSIPQMCVAVQHWMKWTK